MPSLSVPTPAGRPRDRAAAYALARQGREIESAGRLADAIALYQRAHALAPADPHLTIMLGVAYGAAQRWTDLAALLEHAPAQTDDDTAYNLLALRAELLRATGGVREALEAAHALCLRQPERADAWVNLGGLLTNAGQHAIALKVLQRAMELDPGNALALLNNAQALAGLGEFGFAEECLTLALALRPGWAPARFNRAITAMQRGNWATAWGDFESRFEPSSAQVPLEPCDVPRWQGEPIAGRTLLVLPEQGIGDEITFVRFIAPLVADGARVILRCSTALAPLFAGVPGVTRVITRTDPLPDAEVMVPMMSLPLHLGVTGDDIHGAPYLTPQGPCPARIATALAALPSGLRVGLVWAGSTIFKRDHERSIPLALLHPLLECEGVHFVALQVGEARRALEALPAPLRARVTDAAPLLEDFNDTAHVLAHLDLVITCDTGVANLGGALGVPTWVLVRRPSDFRWEQEGSRTAWYDSAQVFRQATPGEWAPVVAEVRRTLDARVAVA